jgi:hypothetical protein
MKLLTPATDDIERKKCLKSNLKAEELSDLLSEELAMD